MNRIGRKKNDDSVSDDWIGDGLSLLNYYDIISDCIMTISVIADCVMTISVAGRDLPQPVRVPHHPRVRRRVQEAADLPVWTEGGHH